MRVTHTSALTCQVCVCVRACVCVNTACQNPYQYDCMYVRVQLHVYVQVHVCVCKCIQQVFRTIHFFSLMLKSFK